MLAPSRSAARAAGSTHSVWWSALEALTKVHVDGPSEVDGKSAVEYTGTVDLAGVPAAAAQATGRGRAYLSYLDALRAERNGDREDAVRNALVAAQLFADIEHPYPQALALELAGSLREALEIYRRIAAYFERWPFRYRELRAGGSR